MIKKIFKFILVILVVVGLIFLVSHFLLNSNKENKPVNLKKETNTIEGYNYTLDNLDSELYKTLFEELKTNLTGNEVNIEEYAKSVAKMFITDVYSLENKINKYDVGGVEFIKKEYKENFVTNLTDTLYKYVEDNTNGKRSQNLPLVSNIEVTNIEKTTFSIDSVNKTYDAYKINLAWEYVNDYEYDKEGEVIVIKDGKKMYVVEKN